MIEERNARIGLRLFWFYAAIYFGFVLWNALAPASMEQTVLGGVSLAVVSGLAVIGLAVVLALLYGVLCRPEPPKTAGLTDRSREQPSP